MDNSALQSLRYFARLIKREINNKKELYILPSLTKRIIQGHLPQQTSTNEKYCSDCRAELFVIEGTASISERREARKWQNTTESVSYEVFFF